MRKLVVFLIFMTAQIVYGQLPTYTLAQVAQHNTASNCWMVLNTNKVYNFTAFIPTHPGGSGMASSCGTDGTTRFNNVGHSNSAVNQEAPYQIGTLSATAPPISVTIVPAIVSVQVSRTQQFVATVANSTQGVTWRATAGTISATGLFTAGATAGTVTVTATSVQDTTKFTTATVTVTAVVVPISVTISPTTANVVAGDTQQFTAAVVSSTQGVRWTTTIGTISTTGLLSTTVAGSGVVTATSVQDATKLARAQVTVTPVTTIPQLTASEVAKHNTRNDCYMIINTGGGPNVYDVTDFIPIHPSAGAMMIPFCGQDATGPFTSVGHSNRAITLLPSFLLGPLVVAPPVCPPPIPQLCTVTQGTNSFTVSCGVSSPPTPVRTYRCTPTVTATGTSIVCTVRTTGG